MEVNIQEIAYQLAELKGELGNTRIIVNHLQDELKKLQAKVEKLENPNGNVIDFNKV